MFKKIIIVGGGIAGLTLANFLKKNNFNKTNLFNLSTLFVKILLQKIFRRR